jgi:hypothetical protein
MNKILLLHPQSTGPGLEKEEVAEMFKELRAFATYAYNYELPEYIKDVEERRFGVRGYQNPELLDKVTADKPMTVIERAIDQWLIQYHHKKEIPRLVISPTKLFMEMQLDVYVSKLMTNLRTSQFLKIVRNLYESNADLSVDKKWIWKEGYHSIGIDFNLLRARYSPQDIEAMLYVND